MKYLIPIVLLCVVCAGAFPVQTEEAPDEAAALVVSRAYLEGISGGDLDDLDALFVSGEASSIYENSSDEGTWLHYKEHHLAPEQASVENFKFTTAEEKAERLGTGFLVRHTGGFSLDAGGETLNYNAAVSFALAPTEKGLRILHVHWSSRKKR